MKINREIPVRQLRLLIFDLDGTLVDSRQDLGNSVNAMLRHFGRHELPLEVIASYIGDGAPMLVRRALGDPKDEHFLHVALQFFLDYYRKHKLDHTYVYDGVIDALHALSAAIAVASVDGLQVAAIGAGPCTGFQLQLSAPGAIDRTLGKRRRRPLPGPANDLSQGRRTIRIGRRRLGRFRNRARWHMRTQPPRHAKVRDF